MTERPILKKKKAPIADPQPNPSVTGSTKPATSDPATNSETNKPASTGFGFGIGKMKELAEAVEKIQKFREDAEQLQQYLENAELVSGSEHWVKVIFNGLHAPLRVTIAEELISKPIETIEVEILAVAQDAFSQSQKLKMAKINEITSILETSS